MISRIKNNRGILFLTVLFSVLLMSCGKEYVYDEEVEIPDNIWTYDQAIDFEFEVEDTTQLYNLYVEVMHHKEYQNQNAYAKLQITFPDGAIKMREVSFELASAEGDWMGECSGDYCRSTLAYNGTEPMRFLQKGKFKMHFEQYTRQDSLEGIRSLRLMLEEAELKKEE